MSTGSVGTSVISLGESTKDSVLSGSTGRRPLRRLLVLPEMSGVDGLTWLGVFCDRVSSYKSRGFGTDRDDGKSGGSEGLVERFVAEIGFEGVDDGVVGRRRFAVDDGTGENAPFIESRIG